jgi:hypothetical protein
MEHCRAVIFISLRHRLDNNGVALFCTNYHRWPSAARPELFSTLHYAPAISNASLFPDRFPKLPSETVARVFAKVGRAEMPELGLAFSTQRTSHFIFYQESTEYWIKATVGLPYYRCNGKAGAPPHGRYLYFHDAPSANVVYAILSSSLFYAYFVCFGDVFHLSDTLVSSFRVPRLATKDKELAELGATLLKDIVDNAEVKQINTKAGDKISYAEFFVWKSKRMIDLIDKRLAELYGLTDEELDSIVNFDAKFRLSQKNEPENEEHSTAAAN